MVFSITANKYVKNEIHILVDLWHFLEVLLLIHSIIYLTSWELPVKGGNANYSIASVI